MTMAARGGFRAGSGDTGRTAGEFRLRQIDRELRSRSQGTGRHDVAAGLPGEAECLAQAQTRAFSDFLGGVERLEDRRHLVGRNARTGVLDRDGYEFPFAPPADARGRAL